MGGELERGQKYNLSSSKKNREVIKIDLSPLKSPNKRVKFNFNKSPIRNVPSKKLKSNLKPKVHQLKNCFSLKQLNTISLNKEEKMNKNDADLIKSSLDKNFFMRNLKPNERSEIIKNLNLVKFKPHMQVYGQGSNPSSWYIVNRGQLEFLVDNQKIKNFQKGDSFGEISLINNVAQPGSVKTVNECELWELKKLAFEKIKESSLSSNYKENLGILKSINLPLKEDIKLEMANHLIKNKYKARETICAEGEIMCCLYLIKEGEVNYFKNKRLSKTYKRRDYFGEEALFEGHRNTYDIVAKTDCTIFSISIDFFHNVFGKGKDFKDQLYFSSLKIAFSKSSNFNSVNLFILNRIFNYFNFKTFKKNNVVYRKGTDVSKKMCIILDGSIVEKGTNKIQGEKNDILFEQKLFKERENKISNDLICDSNCVIAEANYEDIQNEMGGSSNIKSYDYTNTQTNIKNASKLNRVKNDDYMNISISNNNKTAYKYKNYSNKNLYTDSKRGQFSKINNNYFSPNLKNNRNYYRGSVKDLNNYNNNIHNATNYFKSSKNVNNITNNNVSNFKKIHELRKNLSDKNLFYSKMTADKNNNIKNIALRHNFSLKKLDFSNLKKNNNGYQNELSQAKSDRNVADYAKNLKFNNYIKNVQKPLGDIDKISIFKSLNDQKKEIVENNLKIEKFSNGQKILIEGKEGDKLYIIKHGKVDFYHNSKYIKSNFERDNFGYESLVSNDRKNLETVVASGSVECYTISSDICKSVLNKEMKDYFLSQLYLNDYSIELDELENLKLLGRGSYGFVNLVRNKNNRQLYAVKALDLMQIKEENILKRVESEKNLLLRMDHPFIAKAVNYIKNDVFLFYIMEYVRGKELFDVMREINLFNKQQTQFYGASILEVINYLHKQRIIYRDLKPENIMIKENGYIKFIDFGTVKELRDRTTSFVGTYSYMAPEIYRGTGYSFQIDMWSLGVMMYEFFCGKLPFGDKLDEDEDDAMKFYDALMKENLSFPSYIKDNDFKDLIQKMLVKDPSKRLDKYLKIKDHPFFRDFDWERLVSLDLPAPYTFRLGMMKDMNHTQPYLAYLKTLNKKPYYKKLKSMRQIKFQKWLDDF